MRKTLILIILLPALAYGLVMGYLWYDIKRKADQVIAQAAPFAEIRYGSVHVAPIGNAVGLNDIVIRPNMARDEFTIRELRIEAPHILYFLDAGYRVNQGRIPETLGLALHGVSIDLDSELFRMLAEMQAQMGEQQKELPFEQLDALGCGELEVFALADYIRAGMRQIDLDLSLRMNYQEAAQRLRLEMKVADPKLYRLDMTMQFDAIADNMAKLNQDVVPRGNFKYTDAGWFDMRNRYCAGLNGGTVEAYVDSHLSLLTKQLGVTLSPQAAEAYRSFMLKGGTVSVDLNPAPGTALTGLEFYQPADLVTMLGLQIAINETVLDSSAITWQAMAMPKTEIAADAAVNTEAPRAPIRPPVSAPRSTARPVPSAPSYHVVELDTLNSHLGKMVRVEARDGRVREGKLNSVSHSAINLALQGSGGGLTFSMDVRDIRSVAVLY